MASAATTSNLGLPQWVETEKPERTDFNAAFDAMDTTVASHLAEDVHQIGGAHGLEYEVGIWTPTFIGSTGPGTFTYSVQNGNYTRIGKRVFIDCHLSLTVKGASMSGNVFIGGLPFSTKNEINYRSGGAFAFYSSIDTPVDKPYLSLLALHNSSVLNLRVSGKNAGNTPLDSTAITSTSAVIFSMSYEID